MKYLIIICLFLSFCADENGDEIYIQGILFSENSVTVVESGDEYLCAYEMTLSEINGEYLTIVSADENIYDNNNEMVAKTSLSDFSTLFGAATLDPLSTTKINYSTKIAKSTFNEESRIEWIIIAIDSRTNTVIFSGDLLCRL